MIYVSLCTFHFIFIYLAYLYSAKTIAGPCILHEGFVSSENTLPSLTHPHWPLPDPSLPPEHRLFSTLLVYLYLATSAPLMLCKVSIGFTLHHFWTHNCSLISPSPFLLLFFLSRGLRHNTKITLKTFVILAYSFGLSCVSPFDICFNTLNIVSVE